MAQILEYKKQATNDEKLAELMLHVLGKMGPLSFEDLCWMLWRIDSEAFLRTGKSITGCQYYKHS